MIQLEDHRTVGVFWDFEVSSLAKIASNRQRMFNKLQNSNPAQTVDVIGLANSIRKILERYGPIKQFKAYRDSKFYPNSSTLQIELQSSGVNLIDCPHDNRKDVVDKVLIGLCSNLFSIFLTSQQSNRSRCHGFQQRLSKCDDRSHRK
jgi:hypothetical protein